MEIKTNRKRILIVDGDPSVTRAMKEELERTGSYAVCTENEALFSIPMARHFRPDFIFLDAMMTEAGGGSVVERFESDPYLKRIPVVLLTGATDAGNGTPIGSRASIAKPASLDALIRCIEEHTRHATA